MDIRTESATLVIVTPFATHPPGSGGGKGKTARTAKERVITSAGVPLDLPVIPAAQRKGAMRRGVM